MEYDRWFIIITKFDLGNSAIAASALAALALAASALATLISRALPYYSRIISRKQSSLSLLLSTFSSNCFTINKFR